MFLTKECDYAIRVVRELSDLEVKSVKTICANENVPTPFAYKVLKKLEKVGIVCSYRGAKGGYKLARTPESISLHDVVHAIDENLFLSACLQYGHKCSRNVNGHSCKVHQELAKMQTVIIGALMDKKISEISDDM